MIVLGPVLSQCTVTLTLSQVTSQLDVLMTSTWRQGRNAFVTVSPVALGLGPGEGGCTGAMVV